MNAHEMVVAGVREEIPESVLKEADGYLFRAVAILRDRAGRADRIRDLVALLEAPHPHAEPALWDGNGKRPKSPCSECAVLVELRELVGLPPLVGWPEDWKNWRTLMRQAAREVR